MKALRLQLFIVMQCCSLLSFSQSKRIPFEHIGMAQGLSESNILSIIQDKRGFMWFGSWDGLNKYDGYKITVYKNELSNKLSISNNYINCIAEDAKGNLWIATNDGLNCFDRQKETFTRYYHEAKNSNSISANAVIVTLVDKRGKIWIGTINGLDCYDPEKKTFQHINVSINPATNNKKERIRNLYEDSEGKIWVSVADLGIRVINPYKNTVITLLRNNKQTSINSDNINAVFEDSKHRIWLGTNGGGLDLYNEKTNTCLHFTHQDNNPNTIVKNVVLAINEDDNHNLWVSTENGGISIFNYDSGGFNNYQHDEIDRESLTNNSAYCIYKDNKGNMWVGNFAGWVDMAISDKLLFINYDHNMTSNSLSNNNVLSIMEDSKKKIWIGTDGGGLDIFDPQKNLFTHYRHQKNNAATICGDNVLNTMEDSKGNMWVGTWVDGITILNAQRQVIRHFKNNPLDPTSLSCNNAWKIFEDRDKNIWIGTYGGGLELLNPDGKTFTHYHHSDAVSSSLSFDNVVNIFEDKEGKLWLCSDSKGLDRFDKKNKTFSHFVHSDTENSISNNNVNSVFEDAQGNLWIGTMNGLNLYNRKTNRFTFYTTADGLPGDYVFGVLEDDNKKLWISTNNGISRFDPANKTFENYSVTDGLQSTEFKQLAACKSSSGMMYFGGIYGFNQFLPGIIHRKSFDPPLVITNFTVFNKPLPIDGGAGKTPALEQSIGETKSITLPYSSSVFSFEFASLNYTGNERKRYKYMLEGFDKTWIDAGTSRTATYTNLDPGTYTFKISGLNNEGKTSPKITAVTVIITPPFWMTWWFKLVIGAAVFTIIISVYRVRMRVIEDQKIELQKQVSVQTLRLQLSTIDERNARKEAEKAHAATTLAKAELEKSEERYSALFYEGPQPKWVYDIENLQITQVNRAAIIKYGYTEAEFLCMTIQELNPFDDQLKINAGVVHKNKIQDHDFNGRHQHMKKSKEIIEVEIHSSIITVNNKAYRLFIADDITEKIQFENKINKAIITTQEQERYEIGGELHDNVCQILASSQMNMSMLNNGLPKTLVPFYENSRKYIKEALTEIRNLSHRLAPSSFDQMTLEEAFKMLLSSVNINGRYKTSVQFYESFNNSPLDRDLQLNLYRILQEQLRNIVKYAEASSISIDVMISDKNELVMQTSDDGVGFDITNHRDGIGLTNMKRRAELFYGLIEIDSSPGNGCNITIIIPLR